MGQSNICQQIIKVDTAIIKAGINQQDKIEGASFDHISTTFSILGAHFPEFRKLSFNLRHFNKSHLSR
ncbi:MAG: hypothetical protein BWY75_02214 [bacterium ADurb.Bin425]|nr:MAG: hypothetical protein BWY75_02214 [bacterium ADurb.Bin425]